MFVLVALWQPLSLSLSPCIYASIICARPSGDATCTTDGAAIVAAAPPRITGCPDRGVRATFPQHGVCRTVNVCRVTASVPSARAIGCRNVYGWHAHNFELPERVVIGWRYTGEEFAYPSAIVEIGSYNVMVGHRAFPRSRRHFSNWRGHFSDRRGNFSSGRRHFTTWRSVNDIRDTFNNRCFCRHCWGNDIAICNWISFASVVMVCC